VQIGQAAKSSGVTAKMIRHYEAIGLLPAADRRASGYRDYSHSDVHRLQFIRRARDLGFSIDRIRLLLRLWSDRDRSNADVKKLALAHVQELEEKIGHLREMSASRGEAESKMRSTPCTYRSETIPHPLRVAMCV
jgi:MerR family transcriptional regulator, copper efflux regulator